MPVLTSELRRQLENVIIAARDQAESAARSALKKLGVDAAKPHEHFGPKDKALRNQLRACGRQAGDRRSDSGAQEIEQLSTELAYEYWHRMLFARFLAENHLLMHPGGVPVTLEECQELAPGEGAANGFVLAARYAGRMLPQIFPTDDVLLEIDFPANDRLPLEKLLASLPSQTFRADDSLGWVYQFWQSRRKDEVNAKGDKIDARSLPAVTQLFTEHYMVLFLLHNTIGAWHAGKVLAANPSLAQSAAGEDELRKAVALADTGGYKFEYLRFVRGADGAGGPWRPAAGTFDGWPRTAAELKVLDPCCGSGHFLVASFDLLMRLRMAEESLSVADAIDAVLRDNLHGLELDPRCTQIAAFNLAIAAWKLGGHRPLPPLNIACTGVGPQGKKEDWLKLADAVPPRERGPIRLGLDGLYETFKHAPTLGSLIDPKQIRMVGAADYETLAPTLIAALKTETTNEYEETLDYRADAVTAQGLLRAAELLAGPGMGYTLVITNVPYLGRPDQCEAMKAFSEDNFADAKADLAAVFIDRSWGWCRQNGTVAAVVPLSTLLQSRYKSLRKRYLDTRTWDAVALLGPRAFEGIGGEVVSVCLLAMSQRQPELSRLVAGIDASAGTASAKAQVLVKAEVRGASQLGLLSNPEHRVIFSERSEHLALSSVARCIQGLATGDDPQFIVCFWELETIEGGWQRLQGTVELTSDFGGRERVLLWEGGAGRYYRHAQALKAEGRLGGWKSGTDARGKLGVLVSQMSSMPVTLYDGDFYDHSASVLLVDNHDLLPAVWCYASSSQFNIEVRKLDQSLKPSNNVFVQIPFDLASWKGEAAENYPNGLPEPESDDPTQWLFHGLPGASEQPLQVATARLSGYRWPAELDEKMRLSERARRRVKRCNELLRFVDDDGILPIPAMRGEEPLADRVIELLTAAYGDAWSPAVLQKLLADAGMKAGASLTDWLLNNFFEQHCKLFHHRPFIWHIWDGRRDGFNVLVNYHTLDHKRLDSLTHAYLGDWITTQAADAKAGKTGADLRLAAAQALQKKLELILTGEKPYDIFVRWKPLKDQPIGWHPDLNDGVRMNIRPFVEADVLRKTPNIKWTKDRGKDPESAPWFKVFKGERINDHHLSLDEKLKARRDVKV